jgi:hypothetical protein
MLSGLDGSIPLAFLAALGSLRTLSLARPDLEARLGWRVQSGSWCPFLTTAAPLSEDGLVEVLGTELERLGESPALQIGDDLNLTRRDFRRFCERARDSADGRDRSVPDYAAAFGSDGVVEAGSTEGNIQDTALRTMRGAGHQHFLKFMRGILGAVSPAYLAKTLFSVWQYDDPVENLTLRWDPIDDVRYALRWRNPSGDPARRHRGSMLGANALAIAGLPLLPTAPVGSRLSTTGFRGSGSRNTHWTWPIWEPAIPLDVARSLVALKDLQSESPDRERLGPMGIREVYRSQRLTIGKARNFSPARAV